MAGGTFASPLVGELGSELIIVPLRQGRFRIMNNPDKEFGQNEIVCASSDSLTGYVSFESDYQHKDKAGGECAKCPFKEFTKDPKTGRRQAPLCTFNRTFANYLPEHDLVGQLTFRRTSAPAGEDIISIIQQTKEFGHDGFRMILRFIRRGAYSYYVPAARRINIDEGWNEQIQSVKQLLGSGLGQEMAQGAYSEAEADSGATFNSEKGFATE